MYNFNENMRSIYTYLNAIYKECEIISHKSKKPNVYLLDVIQGDGVEATFICNSVTGDLEQLI